MTNTNNAAETQLLSDAADSFGDGVINFGRGDEFFGMTDLTLSATFELNDLDSGRQRLIWNPLQYGIEVINGDDLMVWIRTDSGGFDNLFFANAITDAGWHDTQVVMDSTAGTLEIWFDGEVIHSGSSADMRSASRSIGTSPPADRQAAARH